MTISWRDLDGQDRSTFRALVVFLEGRLEERATIEWALLEANKSLKRGALLDLLHSPSGRALSEPWSSAWRLIEEAWGNEVSRHDDGTAPYEIEERVARGDRSGALVSSIVRQVQPRLQIEPFDEIRRRFQKIPKRPRKPSDLFSTRLTSGRLGEPATSAIAGLQQTDFLVSLAEELESALVHGLDVGRRIGWDGLSRLWRLGGLNRVYYVPADQRGADDDEPDAYAEGIAPAVKLLHAVVARLTELDAGLAVQIARRWQSSQSPVFQRLWAALSRDGRVTSANDVARALQNLGDLHFWSVTEFPEFAELRARRFAEFESSDRRAIVSRIRKLPPRSLWPRKAGNVEHARRYAAVDELRRIRAAGATLDEDDEAWLLANTAAENNLDEGMPIDEGFPEGPQVHRVLPNPDRIFDSVSGETRLKALEAAFSTAGDGWRDDPSERASDWLHSAGNAELILSDLEALPPDERKFPRVIDQFGWAHRSRDQKRQKRLTPEAERVLDVLRALPVSVIAAAVNGISSWLSSWEQEIATSSLGRNVWLLVWPYAVAATNAEVEDEDEIDLNAIVSPTDNEPRDLDTLNTAAGKLVGVFLTACPNLGDEPHPFAPRSLLRKMRNLVVGADGRAGLIGRHRLIEAALGYFLRADPIWTRRELIDPLRDENVDSLALWRALGRRRQHRPVLRLLGREMAARALDVRLGRRTRNSLVFSLVIDCLHSLRQGKRPAVPVAVLQQTLRSVDDEVRTHAADAIQRFVADNSEGAQQALPAEELFRHAAAPFLNTVWPQELSLATAGVSKALADLPATSGPAFVDAVAAIDRFLVPFPAWSLLEYGLYGEKDGRRRLDAIDSAERAAAFLRLLDRTIGTADHTIIPHNLADALAQIRTVGANLTETEPFRRLATAARRTL